MKAFKFVLMSCMFFSAMGCGSKTVFNLEENIGMCGNMDRVEICKDCGLAYMEAGVARFFMPEASDEEYAGNLEAALNCPLPIYSANGFFPKDLVLVGPDAELERAGKYIEVAFRRASEVGVKVMVIGSGRSRNIPEGFDRAEAENQFISILKIAGAQAEKYGMKVVIEPLRTQETNFINTVCEGARVARKTGSESVGVLADFYHMAQNGEDPESLKECKDKLWHCHIAEAEKRTCPGTEGDDFTPYFKVLKEIGYKGRLSFECKWNDNFAESLPVAVNVLKEQIVSVK